MRILCVMLLVFGSIRMAAADQSFEWSHERPLTWDDFKGRVPRDADEKRVAATTASLVWSYRYTIALSDSACSYTIAEIHSGAKFHTDTSWVRPGHRTAAVLQHEQRHFDIAQIFHVRFDDAVAGLVGSSHACSGRNQRRAAEDAERSIARNIGSIYDEIWRNYEAEQQTYDRETGHGTDAAAQARWSQDIESRLLRASVTSDPAVPVRN
jgi:hypothetical protein